MPIIQRWEKLAARSHTDIFDYAGVDNVVLVNAVNCVGIMGKGLAKQFKERYPDNFAAYYEACETNELRPGDVFFYDDPHHELTIANAATKEHWKHKSQVEWVRQCIIRLKSYCEDRASCNLILPMIGCGLGGLDWRMQVRPLVIQHLSHSPANIILLERGNHASAQI